MVYRRRAQHLCADKSLKFSVSSWLSSELHCKKKKIKNQLTWGSRCVQTHSTSTKQRSRGEEQGRKGEGKETELALLQSYILCTILACFPLEVLWKKLEVPERRRRFRIYDMRKPKYKQNKQTVFVGYSSGLYINATLWHCVCPLPSHAHKQIKKEP